MSATTKIKRTPFVGNWEGTLVLLPLTKLVKLTCFRHFFEYISTIEVKTFENKFLQFPHFCCATVSDLFAKHPWRNVHLITYKLMQVTASTSDTFDWWIPFKPCYPEAFPSLTDYTVLAVVAVVLFFEKAKFSLHWLAKSSLSSFLTSTLKLILTPPTPLVLSFLFLRFKFGQRVRGGWRSSSAQNLKFQDGRQWKYVKFAF